MKANTLDTSAKILFNYNSKDDSYYAIGIGGYSYAYSLVKFSHEIGGWQAIKFLGNPASLKEGQLYKLKASIHDNSVDLFVNNVNVFSHALVLDEELQIGLFAWGSNIIEFRNFRYKSMGNSANLPLLTTEQKQLLILNFIKDKGTQQYSVDQIADIFKDKIPGFGVNNIIKDFVDEEIF
ncbi:MAG: hypothetical protein IPL55_00355 [Saprospiraceae bacterium]|nr:hypothetical protein [Saprospiraceae bacterium]